jgi:hypothetical protein
MDASKMSRDQLKKFAAEGKKQKFDPAPWKAIQKDVQELAKGGKSLAELAKQMPEV